MSPARRRPRRTSGSVHPPKSIFSLRVTVAKKPTQERLLELFRLNAETGQLIRKVTTSSRARKGDVAGHLHQASGYMMVFVDGMKYREHLVIWCMLYGEWLPRKIDHEDRNRSNNRPGNLRRATESQQHQNTAVRCDNTSGERGVTFQAGAYVARTYVDGELHYLGRHKRLEDAAAAVRHARRSIYGEFAPSYDQEVR